MTTSTARSGVEDALVSTFFEDLCTFNYDKAKELVDKQKELSKHNSQQTSPIWPMILGALSQLAVAEKSYASFLYLSPKWFGRKDAKGMYEVVASECRKIEDQGMNAPLSALAHICGQLVSYVTLKMDMIELYLSESTALFLANNLSFSNLHAMTGVKFCDRSGLLIKIEGILKHSVNKCHHPQLEPLKSAFVSECEVIKELLKADVSMAQWRFVTALLHLQDAHTKITRLMDHSNSLTTRDTWGKLSFLGMKAPSTPVLYIWLKQYKDAIYSKFSLYFYDVLSKQAPQADMKPYLSRCSVDYYSKLIAFHKKTDAFLISLVLNAEGIEVRGPGYIHNSTPPIQLHGIQAHIAIFCYPQGYRPDPSSSSSFVYLPHTHQASLIMIMSCKEKQLNTSEKPVDFYDEKSNSTYLIVRIDPTVSLVVIYKSKKSDREKKSALSFLQDMSCQLRYTKLFSDLRPS